MTKRDFGGVLLSAIGGLGAYGIALGVLPDSEMAITTPLLSWAAIGIGLVPGVLWATGFSYEEQSVSRQGWLVLAGSGLFTITALGLSLVTSSGELSIASDAIGISIFFAFPSTIVALAVLQARSKGRFRRNQN